LFVGILRRRTGYKVVEVEGSSSSSSRSRSSSSSSSSRSRSSSSSSSRSRSSSGGGGGGGGITYYYANTDFVHVKFVAFDLKILHRHMCGIFYLKIIFYTECVDVMMIYRPIQTKLHVSSSNG
jgi:exo-beta-1,3-glucanase (GH17 family)